MLAGSDRVLFGAAYYHEYEPYDRLDVDLDLMQEAHFSVIRVGESVWSTWEPPRRARDGDLAADRIASHSGSAWAVRRRRQHSS
jgi:beta-galactosidase